jgi:hypothetical protein
MSKATGRLFQNKVGADMFCQTQMASGTLPSSCKHSAQRQQGSAGNITTTNKTYSAFFEPTPNCCPLKKTVRVSKQMKAFVAFAYKITVPRNQSRKVAGFVPKCAKLGIKNFVCVCVCVCVCACARALSRKWL